MKIVYYLCGAVVAVTLVVIVWKWQSGNPARGLGGATNEPPTTTSIDKPSPQPSSKPAPVPPAKPPPPPLETRFVISFSLRNGSDTVGSITMAGGGKGYNLMSTERPGDSIMFSMGGMFGGGGGGMQSMIATGEGSEIRFGGRIEIAEGELIVAKGSRVALRKSKGDWAYVCGLGEYVANGKTNRLGYNRTVDSCLALLDGTDAVLKEGAARDLGRVAQPADFSRVIPKLIPLLNDSSDFLRRGAVEGLGLIGSQAGYQALKDARANETNKLTLEFFDEALAICGGYALMGDPAASKLPDEEAASFFLGEKKEKEKDSTKTDWKMEMLLIRFKGQEANALKTLTEKSESQAARVAEAAKKLLTAVRTSYPDLQVATPAASTSTNDSKATRQATSATTTVSNTTSIFPSNAKAREPESADVTNLRKAAERGDAESQFHLGEKYKTGDGVPKDPLVAYLWFHLAAEKGFGKAVMSRYEVSQLLSQDQIAEAKRNALRMRK